MRHNGQPSTCAVSADLARTTALTRLVNSVVNLATVQEALTLVLTGSVNS